MKANPSQLLAACAALPARWSRVKLAGDSPTRPFPSHTKENTRALHIVDLDLAEDASQRNRDAIRAIANAEEVRIPIQVCGGIRSGDRARVLLDDHGVDRIVLGTAALENPALIRDLIGEFTSKKIIVAIESRSGRVYTQAGAVEHDVDPLASRQIRDVKGNHLLTGLKGTIVRDTTDSRVIPSKGYRFTIGWEQVGALGGDFDFGRPAAGIAWPT